GELRSTAARCPDRLAVVDDTHAVTYAELDLRVRRLANALRTAYGVRPGDPVGLLCHNSVGMVEAMIAVVTLGARAVLINTGLAATQLAAVVERQGIKLLFHDEDLLSLVTATTVARI